MVFYIKKNNKSMRYIIDQDTKTNGKSIIVFWKIYYCITSVKPIVSALASH